MCRRTLQGHHVLAEDLLRQGDERPSCSDLAKSGAGVCASIQSSVRLGKTNAVFVDERDIARSVDGCCKPQGAKHFHSASKGQLRVA